MDGGRVPQVDVEVSPQLLEKIQGLAQHRAKSVPTVLGELLEHAVSEAEEEEFRNWLTSGPIPRYTLASARTLLHILRKGKEAVRPGQDSLTGLHEWANAAEGRERAARRSVVKTWTDFLATQRAERQRA
jgi:hypothetical protein